MLSTQAYFWSPNTTLPNMHSGRSVCGLDCTMTELHSESWKGWAYEYLNLWTIWLQSDWSCTISCSKHKTWYWHATQLSAHTIYDGLRPTMCVCMFVCMCVSCMCVFVCVKVQSLQLIVYKHLWPGSKWKDTRDVQVCVISVTCTDVYQCTRILIRSKWYSWSLDCG